MKKLFSLILALILVFGLAVPAFASNPQVLVTNYDSSTKGYSPKYINIGDLVDHIIKTNADGADYCDVDLLGNTVILSKEIYLKNGDFKLTIKNGTLDGYSRTRAIWINDANTEVAMQNLVIQNCKSDDGGAIYVNDDNCYIHGLSSDKRSVKFVDNKSTNCGGAIRTSYATDNSKIAYITFTGNECADDGGAILCNGYDTTVADCVFENNHAEDAGGAIYAWDKMNIINNEFMATNKADYGEGHDVYCSASGCVLVNNTYYGTGSSRVYNAGTNMNAGTLLSNGSLIEIILLSLITIGVGAIYISSKKKNSAN